MNDCWFYLGVVSLYLLTGRFRSRINLSLGKIPNDVKTYQKAY